MGREDGEGAKVKMTTVGKAVMGVTGKEGGKGAAKGEKGTAKTKVEVTTSLLPEKATLTERPSKGEKGEKGDKGGKKGNKGDKGGDKGGSRSFGSPPSKYDYDYNERQRRDEAKVDRIVALNNDINSTEPDEPGAQPIMELLGAAHRQADYNSWDSFKGKGKGKDSKGGKDLKGGKDNKGGKFGKSRGLEDFEEPLPMQPPKSVPAPIVSQDEATITIYDEDLKQCTVSLEPTGIILTIQVDDGPQRRTVEQIVFSGDQIKFVCEDKKKWYVALPERYPHLDMLRVKTTAILIKHEQQVKEKAELAERQAAMERQAEVERQRAREEAMRMQQQQQQQQQARMQQQQQQQQQQQSQLPPNYMQKPGVPGQPGYPQSAYPQQQQQQQQQRPQPGYPQSSAEAPLLNVRSGAGLAGGYGLYEGQKQQAPGAQGVPRQQAPNSSYAGYSEEQLQRLRLMQQQQMQRGTPSASQLQVMQRQQMAQQMQRQQQQQQQAAAAGRTGMPQSMSGQMPAGWQQQQQQQQQQMAARARAQQQQQHPSMQQQQMQQQMLAQQQKMGAQGQMSPQMLLV